MAKVVSSPCSSPTKNIIYVAHTAWATANAVLTTHVNHLRKGDVVLVSSEVEAGTRKNLSKVLNETERWTLGSQLAVSTKQFTGTSFPFKTYQTAGSVVSPWLSTNLNYGRHYEILSRHGIYTVPKDGTYYFAHIIGGFAPLLNRGTKARISVFKGYCTLKVILL